MSKRCHTSYTSFFVKKCNKNFNSLIQSAGNQLTHPWQLVLDEMVVLAQFQGDC